MIGLGAVAAADAGDAVPHIIANTAPSRARTSLHRPRAAPGHNRFNCYPRLVDDL
ncbi:hypothetical protein [Streptomyces ehimensis]|uniref:Uncharacterized protein n=1 Tax=Streptomyces ehimensis TaxID=68195 RepID=A0ABV9BRT8_9ACTN